MSRAFWMPWAVGFVLSLKVIGADPQADANGTAAVTTSENERIRGSGGFAYPVSTANRRFIDQTGKIYLLKTMSSWAMSQNCSDAEITQELEGLKALQFNAVTVSAFGVNMKGSFGDR